jgi:2-oxoisovalerate dehydrogenase E1 component
LSLDAAKNLEEDGYQVEVIDLRSLVPLDEETILESVKKTNKVLIAHEDKVFGGFGGELSSLITEKAFKYLDAPVKRVGSTFTPVGFNTILEKAVLPDMERIYEAAKDLILY